MRIIINDHKVISWNYLYAGKHWSKRAKLAKYIHLLVYSSIYSNSDIERKFFKEKVDIHIKAYQKRPIDSDNICSKLYIDGLKGILILNDTIEFIGKVTVESIKALNDYVEIDIKMHLT